MKNITFILYVGAACFIVTGLPLYGQSGNGFDLTWSTIDSGGGTSSGGNYVLSGTIGQPDAANSAGGSFELYGGFWPGGALCHVDLEHFAFFSQQWLDIGPDLASDFTGDGQVDAADLEYLVGHWLAGCPGDWPW